MKYLLQFIFLPRIIRYSFLFRKKQLFEYLCISEYIYVRLRFILANLLIILRSEATVFL